MADFRTEFHRRVVADISPAHADHWLEGVKVEWRSLAWNGCDTCGPDTATEVSLMGPCGCGASLSVWQSMDDREFAQFMQRITA